MADQDLIIVLKVTDQGTEVIREFAQQAKQNVTQVQDEVKKSGTSMAQKLEQVGQSLTMTGRRLTIATSIIAGTLIATTKGLIEFGHQLYTTSERTGIATETLSEFKMSAEKSGTSIMAIARGLRGLNSDMYAASKGSKEMIAQFTDMGVKIYDTNGKLKTSTGMLYELADKFANMENETQKSALAMKFFGRVGVEMLPMLNLGSKGLKENADIAKRLGVIYSKETAKAADELASKMTELKAAQQGVYMTLLTTVIPIMISYAKMLTGVGKAASEWMKNHELMAKILTTMGTYFLGFMTVLSPLLWTFGKIAKASSEVVTGFAAMKKAATSIHNTFIALGRNIEGMDAMYIGHISMINKVRAALVALKTTFMALGVTLAAMAVFSIVSKGLRDIKEGAEELNNAARKVSIRDMLKQLKEVSDPKYAESFKTMAEVYNNNWKELMDALEKGGRLKHEGSVWDWLDGDKISEAAAQVRSYYNVLVKGKEKEIEAQAKLEEAVAKYNTIQSENQRKFMADHFEQLVALSEKTKGFGLEGMASNALLLAAKKLLFDVNTELGKTLTEAGMNKTFKDMTKELQFFMDAQKSAELNHYGMDFFAKAMGDNVMKVLPQFEYLTKVLGIKLPKETQDWIDSFKKATEETKKTENPVVELTKKFNTLTAELKKNRETMGTDKLKEYEDQLYETAKALGKLTDTQIGWNKLRGMNATTIAEDRKEVEDLRKAYAEANKRFASLDPKEAISTVKFQEVMMSLNEAAKKAGDYQLVTWTQTWLKVFGVAKEVAEETSAVWEAAMKTSTSDVALGGLLSGIMANLPSLQEYLAYFKALKDASDLTGASVKKFTQDAIKKTIEAIITLARAGETQLGPALIKLQGLFVQLGKKIPKKELIEQLQLVYDMRKALLAMSGVVIPPIDFSKIFGGLDDGKGKLDELESAAEKAFTGIGMAFSTLANQSEGVAKELYSALGALANGLAQAVKSGARTITEYIAQIGAQVGGMLGTAIGGALSGTSGPGNYGAAGSASGALIGTIVALVGGVTAALAPVFTAIGAFIGGLIGSLFSTAEGKLDKVAKKLMSGIIALGIKEERVIKETGSKLHNTLAFDAADITEGVAKAIATDMQKRKWDELTASLAHLGEVIADIGVTQNNLNDFWKDAVLLVDKVADGTIPLQQGTEQLGKAFTDLVAGAVKFGQEGSAQMLRFIKTVQDSKVKVQELTDYINKQLGVTKYESEGAASGLYKMASGVAAGLEDLFAKKAELEKSMQDRLLRGANRAIVAREYATIMDTIKAKAAEAGPALDRLGKQALSVFNAMIKNGATLVEAMTALAPALDRIIYLQDNLGIAASDSIKELLNIRKVQTEYAALFDAIQGNLDVLNALGNTGSLTQESFDMAQKSATDYYNQLIKNGLTEKQALSAMSPTLERIVFLGREQGLTIDSVTQKLVEQGRIQGVVNKEALDTNTIMLAGFGEIVKALHGTIPQAFQDAMDVVNKKTMETAVAVKKNVEKQSPTYELVGMEETMSKMSTIGDKTKTLTVTIVDSASKMKRGFVDVTSTIYSMVGALDEVAKRVTSIGEAKWNFGSKGYLESEIPAQEGGTWKVNGPDQLFRAHQGETVKVSNEGSDNSDLIRKLIQVVEQSEKGSQVTFNNSFEVKTLDVDSFKKVVKEKIAPELEKLSKAEVYKTHPKSVRSY